MIVIGTIVTNGVFAQDKKGSSGSLPKNDLSLNVSPLLKGIIASDSNSKTSFWGIGASYERLVAPHYSIGAELTVVNYSIDGTTALTYFGLDAHGRFYPLSESLEKLFLDAGLGLNNIKPNAGDSTTGLTFGLKTGYKLNVKPKFFIEPSISYNLLKTGNMEIAPLGWQIGLNFGLLF
jgi:hypothetical protein